MTIPYRERGYSVELASLTVHERYQDHAPTAQRTSALGVDNIRRSRGEMTLCAVCFPPLPEPKRPRHREPVPVEDAMEAPTHDSPSDPYWRATSGPSEESPSADEAMRE